MYNNYCKIIDKTKEQATKPALLFYQRFSRIISFLSPKRACCFCCDVFNARSKFKISFWWKFWLCLL